MQPVELEWEFHQAIRRRMIDGSDLTQDLVSGWRKSDPSMQIILHQSIVRFASAFPCDSDANLLLILTYTNGQKVLELMHYFYDEVLTFANTVKAQTGISCIFIEGEDIEVQLRYLDAVQRWRIN